MPMRCESVNGIFATSLTTASMSVMARPPQSPLISSTNVWPNPNDPLGLGAAITHPCAAHSDGFHRADHASSQLPCGPPWRRKTTGYFFEGSNCGGLISQYCTFWPAADVAVRLSGSENRTSFSHDAFSCVNAAVDLPSGDTRKISAGPVSDDLETMTKEPPGRGAVTDPRPPEIRLGTPPAAGTV